MNSKKLDEVCIIIAHETPCGQWLCVSTGLAVGHSSWWTNIRSFLSSQEQQQHCVAVLLPIATAPIVAVINTINIYNYLLSNTETGDYQQRIKYTLNTKLDDDATRDDTTNGK